MKRTRCQMLAMYWDTPLKELCSSCAKLACSADGSWLLSLRCCGKRTFCMLSPFSGRLVFSFKEAAFPLLWVRAELEGLDCDIVGPWAVCTFSLAAVSWFA